MLRTRVFTAVLIATIGLLALFSLPSEWFSLLAAIVLLGVGGWEAARLGGLNGAPARWLFGIVLLTIGLLVWHGMIGSPVPEAFWMGAALWLVLLVWLCRPGLGREDRSIWRVIKLISLGVILLVAWLAVSWLQAGSPWHVLLLIFIISAADIGAFFTGKHFGGAKLAPRISPGKTWSGVAGGLVATVIVTALASIWIPDSPFEPVTAGLIALGLATISIGGDLLISLLKRHRQLKDTSDLLPGHGGVLDRFDSLGAALPFFALAIELLGR